MNLLELVISKGYSKDEAERFIRSGKVLINQEEVIVPSIKVKTTDVLTIREKKEWVSRGAYKLLSAVEKFNVAFQDKVVIDIGSSTGGFTQVALANGADKVYSVDVGTNQLDFSLRYDKRVVVMEKTNLKTLVPEMFKESIDIVVTDVSFISLKRVFDVLENILTKNKTLVALIKPQFEADSSDVEDGGFVSKSKHDIIISNIEKYAVSKYFKMIEIHESPIKGGKSKNIEYISVFKKEK